MEGEGSEQEVRWREMEGEVSEVEEEGEGSEQEVRWRWRMRER